jgi:hypothetical protein
VFVPAGFTKGCSLLGIMLKASQSGVEILHSIQPKMCTHARLQAETGRNRIVGGPDVMDAKPDKPMGGG